MFNLVPLIILLPLLGVVINGALGYRLGRRWVGIIGAGVVGLSFILSILVTMSLGALPADERQVYVSYFTWMRAGDFNVPFEFLVDPLSGLMLLVVTGIGFLIHLYSIGYMDHDAGYARFFTYLNLFIFSMLVLVLGANFLLLFAGWELVGLCSFLLISFWFTNTDYATAGRKAFIVNRIGDFGFALGIMLIFVTFGTLNFREVFANASQASVTTVTIITLLLFVGAIGKSAQIPLFVWLPDAMAGPTPVSALIHAATMVTAGVYMVARSNALYDLAPMTQVIVATVGTLTALFAALIAITQTDIKKVLAYSTVSQLGYMMLGVGAGAYVAGVFHLYTHAFFKALLFLGAGAVMHALNNEQDMTRMGGLFKYIRITSITFIIGAVALAGIPPLAAFWSKDLILEGAFYHGGWYMVLWAIGILTAAITAFYSMRQVGLIFFGEERWRHAPEPAPAPAHTAPAVATAAPAAATAPAVTAPPAQTVAPVAPPAPAAPAEGEKPRRPRPGQPGLPAAAPPAATASTIAPAPSEAPAAPAPASAPAEGEKPKRPRPGQVGLPTAAPVAATPVEPAAPVEPSAPSVPDAPAPAVDAPAPAAAAPGEKPRRPRPGQVSLPTAASVTPSVSETLPPAETPSAPDVPMIVESTAAETPADPAAPTATPGEKPKRPRPGQPGLAPAAPAAVTPPAEPTAPTTAAPAATEGDKPRRPRPGQPGLTPAAPTITTPAARPEAGQEPLSTAPAVAHGAPPQAVPAAHGVAHEDHGHDGHGEPHESPLTMTIPLMVLAVGSVIAGFAGIPGASMIEHWLEPVVSIAEHHGGVPIIVLTAIATLASLIGAFLGMSMYGVPLGPVKLPKVADPVRLGEQLKPLYNLSYNKFYVDEIYNTVFVEPFKRAAAWFWQAMDQGVIDAAVNGVGVVFTRTAALFRRLQTGYVRSYAVSMLAGVVVLLFWFIFFRLR